LTGSDVAGAFAGRRVRDGDQLPPGAGPPLDHELDYVVRVVSLADGKGDGPGYGADPGENG
jgi:hypothetical protein